MHSYFIRTSSNKVIGPFEPFEVLQRARSLRDEGAELVITDDNGNGVDEKAIARGDILSPRDEELVNMMETEFPSLWKMALEDANDHRNVALSMIVRLVRRHIEVAANERERRLTGAGIEKTDV